ncbi:MAG: aminomethyl-transferring glycine dehydrogenase subunit GcvPA [Candidatus Kapabacteria bacterium]|nr:aminomethyl-transferring glycine dehydrogenase subunit GcvPA [Candidatus Kapabacteria bacterium]
MVYVPNTDNDRKKMLDRIGVDSFDELIEKIPAGIRLTEDLNLPPKLSEYEIVKLLEDYAAMNVSAKTHTCFMGGGSYDHFIPSIVNSITARPEYKTAYTPYQAEVSQGTLQTMYEYQSMICDLTGMDVTNASMYDGASSLAEACLLSSFQNKRTEFAIAGTLNPHYREVLETVCAGRKLTFTEYVLEDGTCDIEALRAAMDDTISAVVVQQPNFYGTLEDVNELEKIAHGTKKTMFITSVDPISLGLLKAPGEYNADIVTAEGQSLGIPMNFGGPYLGIFSTTQKLVRKIPGRLSGVTQDTDGNRGFVLTLQTREQQIKREKATSNICSNQGLMMVTATVYLATMGKQGIKEVAEQSFNRAHYLSARINELPGFSLMNDKPFFREFLVNTPVPPAEIIEAAQEAGILAGIDTTKFENCKSGLLIAVTEKRTKDEMDKLVNVLKKFA